MAVYWSDSFRPVKPRLGGKYRLSYYWAGIKRRPAHVENEGMSGPIRTTTAWLANLSHQSFLCQILKDSSAKWRVGSWSWSSHRGIMLLINSPVRGWHSVTLNPCHVRKFEDTASFLLVNMTWELAVLAMNPVSYNFLNSDITNKEIFVLSAGKALFPQGVWFGCQIERY